jgi:hypothetical protein
MPTPKELAQIVEQYDEQDWYDFLDELDEVSRRRRQREPEPEPPVGNDRDALAEWIARRHFLVGSSIREIWYLTGDSPPEEIRLLELDERFAGPDQEPGRIGMLEFALGMPESPFRLFVADVTSDELEEIQAGRLSLPAGWKLDGARIWRRRE